MPRRPARHRVQARNPRTGGLAHPRETGSPQPTVASVITFPGQELRPGAHGVDDDRACIAVGDAHLEQGAVAGRADEHREIVVQFSDLDRVAEDVAHVVIGDAVLAGARRDVWHTQPSYLAARMTASYLAAHAALPAVSHRPPSQRRPVRRLSSACAVPKLVS